MTLKNQKNIFLFAFKSLSALDLMQLQTKASYYQRKYNIEFESFIDNITKVDAR